MKKTMHLAALLTLAAMVIFSTTALAQPGGRGPNPPKQRPDIFGKVLHDLSEELGLSDSQEVELKDLERDHAKEIIMISAEGAVIGIDLAALFEVQGNDSQVRSTHESLKAKGDEGAAANLDFQLDRRAVFSSDQWALIVEALEEYADGREDRDPRDEDAFEERLAEIQEAVGLSDDQVADLNEIREALEEEVEAIREELESLREELKELMSTQGNDGNVRATDAEIEDLKNEIDDLQLEARLDARNVYTASQWEAYLEWREGKRYEESQGQRRGPGGNN